VKITVGVDRFTDLRARMRRALSRGDDDAQQEAFDEFAEHMRERAARGTFTQAEERWLEAHPKFEAYLEHGHGEEGWSKGYDWTDIFCD
jgi:4-alpha-glucanotransferase